jgi:hypothetical protein
MIFYEKKLLSICDELEAGLTRSQADSEKLMEAVVGRMLAGGESIRGTALKNQKTVLKSHYIREKEVSGRGRSG